MSNDVTDKDLGFRDALDGLLARDGVTLEVGINKPRKVAKYAAIQESRNRFLRDTVDARDEAADLARIQRAAVAGRPLEQVTAFGEELVAQTRNRIDTLGLIKSGAMRAAVTQRIKGAK